MGWRDGKQSSGASVSVGLISPTWLGSTGVTVHSTYVIFILKSAWALELREPTCICMPRAEEYKEQDCSPLFIDNQYRPPPDSHWTLIKTHPGPKLLCIITTYTIYSFLAWVSGQQEKANAKSTRRSPTSYQVDSLNDSEVGKEASLLWGLESTGQLGPAVLKRVRIGPGFIASGT